MNTPRQNFGIALLKNNPDKKDKPMEFLKIVVAGGQNGTHYLNSVEIYDIQSNVWT